MATKITAQLCGRTGQLETLV